MKPLVCAIKATTLTPFCYHSLMVQSGSSTLPELVSDRAVAFGLAAALGMMNRSVALPCKDYRAHLSALPYRTSVFTTPEPKLLPPVLRRLNLDGEGGFSTKLSNVVTKGNLTTFFYTQEVPSKQEFTGALFGCDPFAETGRDYLVIRIGLHRNGMLKLEPAPVDEVRLNVWTAGLFGRNGGLTMSRYLLHSLQLTPFLSVEDALREVMQWK